MIVIGLRWRTVAGLPCIGVFDLIWTEGICSWLTLILLPGLIYVVVNRIAIYRKFTFIFLVELLVLH